jgi:hypothetical protein
MIAVQEQRLNNLATSLDMRPRTVDERTKKMGFTLMIMPCSIDSRSAGLEPRLYEAQTGSVSAVS